MWLLVLNREARERPRHEGHVPSQYADRVLNFILGTDNDPPAPLAKEGVEELILENNMINQYTPKKSLEIFGEETVEATMKEPEQIDNFNTYTPIICIIIYKDSESNNTDVEDVNIKGKNGDTYNETYEVIVEDVLEDIGDIKEVIDDNMSPPYQ